MNKMIILIFLEAIFSFAIYPQRLVIDKSKINNVKFFAEATLGDFEGSSGSVEGYIELNEMKIMPGCRIDFRVYLDSIDTGIGLRNTHMREDYLETEKFPQAVYAGKIASIDSLSKSEYLARTDGEFEIHGIKRRKKIEVKIYNYGQLYKSVSDFSIRISDFKISQPSFLFNTVDDNVKIHLSVYLKRI